VGGVLLLLLAGVGVAHCRRLHRVQQQKNTGVTVTAAADREGSGAAPQPSAVELQANGSRRTAPYSTAWEAPPAHAQGNNAHPRADGLSPANVLV